MMTCLSPRNNLLLWGVLSLAVFNIWMGWNVFAFNSGYNLYNMIVGNPTLDEDGELDDDDEDDWREAMGIDDDDHSFDALRKFMLDNPRFGTYIWTVISIIACLPPVLMLVCAIPQVKKPIVPLLACGAMALSAIWGFVALFLLNIGIWSWWMIICALLYTAFTSYSAFVCFQYHQHLKTEDLGAYGSLPTTDPLLANSTSCAVEEDYLYAKK